MAMSEDMYRKKMLEIEREKLEVEKNTTKVLSDIRDLLLAHNVLRLAEIADNPKVSVENFNSAKGAFKDAKSSIEKRWEE